LGWTVRGARSAAGADCGWRRVRRGGERTGGAACPTRRDRCTRDTGPSAALSHAPQTGSLAAHALPCGQTGLTRFRSGGGYAATRSASQSLRRGCGGWTRSRRGGPRRGLRTERRRCWCLPCETPRGMALRNVARGRWTSPHGD
jgi:hypothetical protein